MDMQLSRDWLIIGGGPTALRVVKEAKAAGVPHDQIAVVDPKKDFLARMRQTVKNTDAQFLFSTIYESGLGNPMGFELVNFLKREGRIDNCEEERGEGCGCFGDGSTYRARFEDFWRYALLEAADAGFNKVQIRGTVEGLQYDGSSATPWQATLASGQKIRARNVVGAGAGAENVLWPEWTNALHQAGLRSKFEHVLSPNCDTDDLKNIRVGIVGGGMSGCGSALKLLRQGCHVTLVASRPMVVAKTCVDTAYSDWDAVRDLHQLDPEAREVEIAKNRVNGAVTARMKGAIEAAQQSGSLVCHWTGLHQAVARGEKIGLQITGANEIEVDYLLLATGLNGNFETTRLAHLIRDAGLELPLTRKRTYPLLDANCRWGAKRVKNLFVVGPFSDLAIGPNAGLFAGMNLAARHALRPVLANS